MEIIHRLLIDFSAIGASDIGALWSILFIDVAFSGDNSIAINALAMNLPRNKRNRAVWLGMMLAGVLRFVALVCASFIMKNAWVQILGALYLLHLGWAYFTKETKISERDRVAHSSLFVVLLQIAFLDMSLSLDNTIAVLAMSQNLAIIVIGVLSSIAMLAVAAQVVRKLMERYALVESAAYLILIFLGAVIIAEKGAPVILQISDLLVRYSEQIAALVFRLDDAWKVSGVIGIFAAAIAIEEIRKFCSFGKKQKTRK